MKHRAFPTRFPGRHAGCFRRTLGRAFLAAWPLALAATAWGQRETPVSLPARLQWVQFFVASGRITATSAHVGQTMSREAKAPTRQERLSVNVSTGEPAVNYELTTETETLSIEISEADEVRIRRRPKGNAPGVPMDFRQVANQESVLTLGVPPNQQVIRGKTLWHLFLAEPDACRQNLIPVLETLRPGWRLAETGRSLEEALYRAAEDAKAEDRQRWTSLVAGLASDEFAERQAADRALREAGPVVLPFLRGLDRSLLDAEQRFRLRRIIAALSDEENDDTPERIAPWLVNDPGVWCSLLARADEAKRRAAAARLAFLLNEPIDFDPKAEPAVRQTQIDRLRKKIEPSRPQSPGSNGARVPDQPRA
jgi:hypothetical protein